MSSETTASSYGIDKAACDKVERRTGAVRWWVIRQRHLELVEPGFIEFTGRTGQFGFIAVRGWLDCRPVERDGQIGVEFTWEGVDEGEQVSGRGWASLADDETIDGHLFFHNGDDSSFRAKPFTADDRAEGQ